MAINKNDYLDVDGNYELKKDLVDELIDGVDANLSNISSLTSRLSTSPVGDMNTVTGSFRTFIVGANTINTPSAADGLGFQINNGTYTVQFIIRLGTNTVFHRTHYGSWGAWKTVTSV